MIGGRSRHTRSDNFSNVFNEGPEGAGLKGTIDAQGVFSACPAPSVIYFLKIGKHVKIGYTTNLPGRIATLSTGSPVYPELILSVLGDRETERRIHDSLAETRVRGEFFQYEYRLDTFIRLIDDGDVSGAWSWLDATHPTARDQSKRRRHEVRVIARRQAKSELDAYYASLVAKRKEALGW